MLKLLYSAPTACVGWFSDKVSLLLNYTWGGLITLLRGVLWWWHLGGGGFLMYSEAVFLCDGKLDISLPSEMMNHLVTC